MKGIKCIEILSNPGVVNLKDIPVLDYQEFRTQTVTLLGKDGFHCVNYFTAVYGGNIHFLIVIANDEAHKVLVYSHTGPEGIRELESVAKDSFQLHVFEREISENEGIIFRDSPWPKPLRYPSGRADLGARMKDYPFYKIDSEETHEVGVGPVHAGIIEPGHFRFLCYGEKVLHLEIQLGYQHRGIEEMFLTKKNLLQKSIIAENIAGDTATGHASAFSQLAECISGITVPERLHAERTIALEMERMAVHIGDIAALCGDVAYQLGQSACEALRTIVINSMQDWCGNRFGKGLIRPGGSNFSFSSPSADRILENLDGVHRRFREVTDLIFQDSGVLARFENTGTVTQRQALLSGAVGMAARSAGLKRDIRKSHPFLFYRYLDFYPASLDGGDVLARAMLRKMEFEQSWQIINEAITALKQKSEKTASPDYNLKFRPDQLGISLVEGWRGEICHCIVTGADGGILKYKIKDPSVHNWYLLALAVRDQEISDFPVCNKSFNLAYCGNDL